MGVAQIPNWTTVLAATGSTNSAPTLAAHGVAVNTGAESQRGIPLHIAVTKANTATVTIYGYATALAAWFAIETYTWGGDSISHAEPLEFGAAYNRIYAHVSALGGGNIAVFMGEIDAGAY